MAISLRLGLLRSLRHGCPQQAFVPALTADVGFWATLSLNMCDFTRYANSQRSQLVGQAMGLPLCMAVFGFLSLAITASTIVIYGTAITDPLELLGRIPGVLPQTLTLAGLIIATLTTNIAANVVAPANAFVNIAPRRISFEAGGLVAAGIGAVILPWKLISDSQGFIFTWLIAYSALLGPVAGVMFADFFILRQRRVEVTDLFVTKGSSYWYVNGWSPVSMIALAMGVLPNLPGWLFTVGLYPSCGPMWIALYHWAWFTGFGVASAVYLGLKYLVQKRKELVGQMI